MNFSRLSGEGSAVYNKRDVPNLVFHPPSLRPFVTNQQTFYTFGNTLPRHSSLNSGSCAPHHLQLVHSLC